VEDLSRERAAYPQETNGNDTDTVRTYPAEVEISAETGDFDAFHQDFYDHYWGHYQITGRSFGEYLPAYQYGYRLAHDARYTDLEWSRLEPRARLYWEEHHVSPWDDLKDAVGYAWNRVRAAVE
jgi:hypothetical protein